MSGVGSTLRAGAYASRAVGVTLWKAAERVDDARSLPRRIIGGSIALVVSCFIAYALLNKKEESSE